MTWQIPWVISGVPEIPLDVTRVFAYAATNGQDGVIDFGDLKVTEVSGGSSSVQIAPGAFATLSRFAGGLNASQSYIGYNAGPDVITMPTNATAGTRYDLVYAHITDPGKEGEGVSPAPVETRVIQGVSSTVRRVQDVPGYANVTGYALARITRPASSSTVIQTQIEDLRELALTKSERIVRVTSINTGTTDSVTASSYTTFPSASIQSVPVPVWANRVAVIAHVTGVRCAGSAGNSFNGSFRVRMSSGGSLRASTGSYLNYTLASNNTVDTISIMAAMDTSVDPTLNGNNTSFVMEALRSSGTATLQATTGTTVVYDITFYRAVG